MTDSSHTSSPLVGGASESTPWDVAAAEGALVEAVRRDLPDAGDGLVDDLSVAARAAWRGGIAACDHYGDDLDVEHKAANDPVTEADHASNRAILRVLAAAAARDRVLSEESPPPDPSHRDGRLWVVDPLDGTKEFIARNGEFSVMVGLAVEGRAFLGAVYQPAVDRLYAGITAGGAWVVAEAQQSPKVRRLRLAKGVEPRRPIRFVRSRSHPDERLRRLARELGRIEKVISGSVGIKCALVATGEADLYVHPVPYLKEWDTCAPEALLRGAGGTVTDCSGSALEYGKKDSRQGGGIFAATDAAWRYARPMVVDVTAPLFGG